MKKNQLVRACGAALFLSGMAHAAPPAATKNIRFGFPPPPAGMWEDITPAGFDDAYVSLQNYGVAAIVGGNADQPDTFYLSGGKYAGAGIWKSTDNAATWRNVSGAQLVGANYGLTLDPTDSNVLYTTSLYGFGAPCCGDGGVAKSTDGAVTWRQVGNKPGMNNDIAGITMDPTDHLHLVVLPHSGRWNVYETFDGGLTWTIHPPFAEGAAAQFFTDVDDAGQVSGTVWIYQSASSGVWRTTTGGRVGGTAAQRYRDGTPDPAAWTRVNVRNKTHGATAVTRLDNGGLLMSLDVTIMRSDDNGRSWIDLHQIGDLPNSGDALAGLGNDGAYIWTMMSNTGCGNFGTYAPVDFPAVNNCGPNGYRWLVTPAAGDGAHWTEYNAQVFQNGPHRMLYDARHRTLYSASWSTGLFRLKLP